jgi:glycosyltransferase involved in cell wall biosynthesis
MSNKASAMDPAQPDVSVVIPFFNNPTAVLRAIDVVFAQSHENWELIVVDDGSFHQLAECDRKVDDPRVRWLRHETNRGVSVARNTGVAAARGAFIAFLDADDEWTTHKLERQLAAARASSSPHNALCLTKVIVKSEGKIRIRPERQKRNTERFDEYLFIHGGFAQTSSFFLGRTLADRIEFRPQLRQYEDHLYLIDADLAGAEYVFIDEPLTIYNDDDVHGRLSLQARDGHAVSFLREAGDALSPNARLSFEVRYMSVDMIRAKPLVTVRLALRALYLGALKPRYLFALFLRSILPCSWYALAKNKLVKWHA